MSSALYLIILALFGLWLAFYPLRMHGLKISLLLPLGLILLGLAYWHWGAWAAWQRYLQEKIRYQQVQTVIRSLHGPEELIQKLKDRLHAEPESAKGWYLLGRLYSTQSQWQEASDAFAKAHRLKPHDEKITVNYAESLWQLHTVRYDQKARALLKHLLRVNPNQADALTMLATDAYQHEAYQQAIDYWQHLLMVVPPQSEDAKTIQRAIVKAQGKL
jgi:cytochrome c-type biogenesis protein CcmH